jgi:pimeloyl-ACP methyl ester carboxylesterase
VGKLVLAVALVAAWFALRGRPEPYDVTDHLEGGRRTRLREGRLYSRTFGDGPDLVLLPGFAGNSRTWEFVTPELARHYRVHWLDPLGHGLSDKPADARYDGAAQAERLVEWLDAHHLSQVVLAASSAGAQAAVKVAADHPERVLGLLLVDPFLVAGRYITWSLRLAKLIPAQSAAMGRMLYSQRWYVRIGQMLGRYDSWGVTEADVDRQYLPYGSPGFFEALPAMLREVDPAKYAGAIAATRCPVLLVWGESDRTAASTQVEALAEQFRDAEIHIVEKAGHLVQEEQPEALLVLAQPFLDRVTRSAAAT